MAQQQLAHYQSQYANFELLIRQVLAQDPRPAYRKRDLGQQEYGMRLYDCNIRWQINADICTVVSIDSVWSGSGTFLGDCCLIDTYNGAIHGK